MYIDGKQLKKICKDILQQYSFKPYLSLIRYYPMNEYTDGTT